MPRTQIYKSKEVWLFSIFSSFEESLKPIFHQNAKYLASGTFASPNAKYSTSASPNARIPTYWYILP